MTRARNRLAWAGTAALLLASSGPAVNAHAQTGGGYDLTWSTLDGGGGTFSAGGGFSLGGAAGQPDASIGQADSLTYMLAGGFWGVTARQLIYLPLILR